MNLSELLDRTELDKNIQDGLINVQVHPSLPLRIFNYSHAAAGETVWTRSMSLCRGLIVDDTDRIIARPFAKFWNYADPRHPETMPENLPATLPELTVKQDGSLLIGFQYKGTIGIATRGSFTSDQAIWANQFVKKNYPKLSWSENWTPLWEGIANFNRIVVDYEGWEGFISLALVWNETGEEADRIGLETWSTTHRFSVTPLVNKKLEACVEEDLPNFEGYVATWRVKGGTPLRAKIKQETYKKLHRILTGLNQKTVWEMLSTGQQSTIHSLLSDTSLPKEFKVWLSGVANDLTKQYNQIEYEAREVFHARPVSSVRKDQAMYFKQTPHLCSVLFALLDGKENYQSIIWDRIKPKIVRTFKKDGE